MGQPSPRVAACWMRCVDLRRLNPTGKEQEAQEAAEQLDQYRSVVCHERRNTVAMPRDSGVPGCGLQEVEMAVA